MRLWQDRNDDTSFFPVGSHPISLKTVHTYYGILNYHAIIYPKDLLASASVLQSSTPYCTFFFHHPHRSNTVSRRLINPSTTYQPRA